MYECRAGSVRYFALLYMVFLLLVSSSLDLAAFYLHRIANSQDAVILGGYDSIYTQDY